MPATVTTGRTTSTLLVVTVVAAHGVHVVTVATREYPPILACQTPKAVMDQRHVAGTETRVFVRSGRLNDWWTCGRAIGAAVYAAFGDGQVLVGTIPHRLRVAENVSTNIRRGSSTVQVAWYRHHQQGTMVVLGKSGDVGIPVHKDHTLLMRSNGGRESNLLRLESVYGRRLRVVTSASSLLGSRSRSLALLPLSMATEAVADTSGVSEDEEGHLAPPGVPRT